MQQGLGLAQTTILAPQLQQSLNILQAPALELQALVRQELETNPVLEEAPPDEAGEEAGDELDDETEAEKGEEGAGEEEAFESFAEEFRRLSQIEEDWRADEARLSASLSGGADEEERRRFFFDSIAAGTTLQEHLLEQVGFEDLDAETRRAAEALIGAIDDAGYLTADLEELARGAGVTPELMRQALRVVQGLEPPGVGARDLREALLLQLERAGRGDSLEARIVRDHLDDLARHRYPDIARRLRVDVAEVQEAAEAIGRLDPRPGGRFSPEGGRYVVPDAVVERDGGEFQVIVNNDYLPRLRISRAYKEMLASGVNGAAEYLKEKIRGGKFLIRSIHQRQQTLENICRVIVELQREFFEKGPAHLKPMTMGEVAERIGVHETTVSRAVSGKYLATPFGMFEMRHFFTPGYRTGEGESLSNTSVKEAVAALVRGEDPRAPLSDAQIVEKLREKGLEIARRTVAKYREELGILPSNLRRRY